ncbi:CHASE2 domain-containing protein [Psychrobacter sp. I-STPA10]|uniref:CHASE2 domain-containing protein n=1 Tax=Psychrobacter sp. I-STPA10 TaxID=2585769 RepID=UPI001E601487|nr:CHASE2 domain-containing protein [Psychrobacter sp. I-STPA10]
MKSRSPSSFLFKLLILAKLILYPFIKVVSWLLKSTKTTQFTQHYFIQTKEQLNNLSDFSKRFLIAMAVGIVSSGLLSQMDKITYVHDIKESIFDTTLQVFTEYSDKKGVFDSEPVLLVIDEESEQNSEWLQDPDKQAVVNILQLVDKAYQLGSRHVFIDFTFEVDEKNLAAVQSFIDKYKDNPQPLHLYVATSTMVDPCLPNEEYFTSISDNIWLHYPLQSGNLYIHPVSPTYYQSTDGVVRYWKLFNAFQWHASDKLNASQGISDNIPTAHTASNDVIDANSRWVFLPSPQLAYHVVKSIEAGPAHQIAPTLAKLPWLHSFDTVSSSNSNLTTTARKDFINNTYEQLITLSDDNKLKSFCQLDTTQPCIAPTYLAKDITSIPKGYEAYNQHDFQNHLANPTSEQCNITIDYFVNNFVVKKDSDIVDNRIIYSMKSWQEDILSRHEKKYQLTTPLMMLQSEYEQGAWQDSPVAIGAAYASAKDNFRTPIGDMPGVLVNLNALVSFDQFGSISEMTLWQRIVFNGLIIVMAALIFAKFSPKWATFINIGLVIICIVLFYHWMFSQGVWLEFGLPLLAINIAQYVFEYVEHRNQKRQKIRQEYEKNKLVEHNQNLKQQWLQETQQKLALQEQNLDIEKRLLNAQQQLNTVEDKYQQERESHQMTEKKLLETQRILEEMVKNSPWDKVDH